MIRLSACIEPIFRDLPFVERMARAAETDVDAVEFWGWGNKDIDAVAAEKERLNIPIAAFGLGGGSIVDEAAHEDFLKTVKDTVAVAERLDVQRVIVTTGNEIEGRSREEQHANIVAALKQAAPIAEQAGFTFVLEPLNLLVDHAGYYLSTSAEAFEIVDEVASPNVKVLYDIYHQQITEGHLIATIEANIEKIGHFHSADNPGRHEWGTGEINYVNVLRAIDGTGYDGYVGLEYKPTKDHAETLRECIAIAQEAMAVAS